MGQLFHCMGTARLACWAGQSPAQASPRTHYTGLVVLVVLLLCLPVQAAAAV
jgi:hypothetical protein